MKMFKKIVLVTMVAFLGCADLETVQIKGVDGVNGTNGTDGQNGSNGQDGVDGINGISCFIAESTIVCGESTFNLSQLAGPMGPQGEQGIQGIPGLNGSNGQSCIVIAIEGGAQILCGDESSVVLHDGVNGLNGEDGIDGVNGTNGSDGQNGSSCSVEQVQAGALITCTDGSSVLIPFKVCDDSEGNEDDDSGSVKLCHKPGTAAEHNLSVAPSAIPAHLGHGDYLGSCK